MKDPLTPFTIPECFYRGTNRVEWDMNRFSWEMIINLWAIVEITGDPELPWRRK